MAGGRPSQGTGWHLDPVDSMLPAQGSRGPPGVG